MMTMIMYGRSMFVRLFFRSFVVLFLSPSFSVVVFWFGGESPQIQDRFVNESRASDRRCETSQQGNKAISPKDERAKRSFWDVFHDNNEHRLSI
eukprot:scaffold12318_cov151-Amphora_coffeaeformis.AAC.9